MKKRAYPTEAFQQHSAAQQTSMYGAPPPQGGAAAPMGQPVGQPVQPASPTHAPVVPTYDPSQMVPGYGQQPVGFTPAPVPSAQTFPPQPQYTSNTGAPQPISAPALEPMEPVSAQPAQSFAPQPVMSVPNPNQVAQQRHAPPPQLGDNSQVSAPINYGPPPQTMNQPEQPTMVGKRPVGYSTAPQPAPASPYTPGGGMQDYGSPATSSPSMAMGAAGAAPVPDPSWDCDPRICTMTVNSMPRSDAVTDKVALPFGCIIHPLADVEKPIPVVNFGPKMHIIRCQRCRAYINPYVSFVEGGKRWKCNLCYLLNEVPREYFSIVGADGRRYDHAERVELNHACVEFEASPDFMQRPPQPPIYFFIIDVSYTAVASGMVRSVCGAISKAIENELEKNPRTRVGFITVDSSIHFYNMHSSLSKPQMLVVPDIAQPFKPASTNELLVNLADSRHLVDEFLKELLPNFFLKGQDDRLAYGPALYCAVDILAQHGGKIVSFLSTLPSVGVGKLANRAPTGTATAEKAKAVLQPAEQFYKNIALDCYKKQVGCDLFLFTPKYIDAASLGCLARYTGGQLNHYLLNQFSPHEASRMQDDVYRVLTRNNGFEAVMRLRCSKGLTLASHHGSFFLRGQDLVSLPNVDNDKAFAFRFKVADAKVFVSARNRGVDGNYYASIQAGLLYTTKEGQRRIRVITKCCPITDQPTVLYQQVNIDACMNLIAKLAISKALEEGPQKAQLAIKESCIDTIAKYTKAFVAPSAQTTLMLPPTLLKYPLLSLAVAKNAMFRLDASVDATVAEMLRFNTLSIELTTLAIHPNLYNLTAMPAESGLPGPDGAIVMPPTIELTCEKLDRRGIFLLDNGKYFVLWVGGMVDPQVLSALFDIQSLDQVDPSNSQLQLIRRENELSNRVNNILDTIRRQRSFYQWLYPIKEKDPMERYLFFVQLIQDRFGDGPGFREFIVELQKTVNERK